MRFFFLNLLDRINDKYGALLFYIGLFLLIVSRYWFLTNKETPNAYYILYALFHYAGRLLILCRLLLFSHKYPLYVLFCIVIGVFLLYSYSLSGFRTLIYSFIIIAASKDANIKVILNVFLLAFLLVLCMGLVFWNCEWISDLVKHKFDLIGHSWGFMNPNFLAFFMLMATLLVLQYWDIKQTKVIWITCWSVAFLVFKLTLGLTSVIILLLIPIIYYFLKHYSIDTRYLAFLPWFFLLTSIILSCYYGSTYGETTFESRFSIPALVYQKHGLSLFGQEYGYVTFFASFVTGEHPLCVDNLYMHLVLCDGVIIALFVFIFLSHYLYKIGKWGHPLLVSSAIGFTLSGMMENQPIDALLNFMLLYYFHCFTPHSKTVQKFLAANIAASGLMTLD